jgi:hypothetical protein
VYPYFLKLPYHRIDVSVSAYRYPCNLGWPGLSCGLRVSLLDVCFSLRVEAGSFSLFVPCSVILVLAWILAVQAFELGLHSAWLWTVGIPAPGASGPSSLPRFSSRIDLCC